ncbi:MAG: DUF4149 domain-containing protein [Zoogloeaceae bacterium]|nr:DUF4149 domain-containing protein [Zoogloeaceae bacterium]
MTSPRQIAATFVRSLTGAFFQVALTAWVGMLWTVGYLVVPALFRYLPDRTLAGQMAGHLFCLSGWLGLILGGYVLVNLVLRHRSRSLRRLTFWLAALMLILTAVSLFGIQPFMQYLKEIALPAEVMQSPQRDRFVTWHGISSSLYLLQSLLALGLLLLLPGDGREASAKADPHDS